MGQDEETEARRSGTVQKEEVQTKELQDLKSGTIQKEVQVEIHKTLKEGVKKKKNQREFRNKKRWRLF